MAYRLERYSLGHTEARFRAKIWDWSLEAFPFLVSVTDNHECAAQFNGNRILVCRANNSRPYEENAMLSKPVFRLLMKESNQVACLLVGI